MKKKPSTPQAITSLELYRVANFSNLESAAMRDLCMIAVRELTTAEQQEIIRNVDMTLDECLLASRAKSDNWKEKPWFLTGLHAMAASIKSWHDGPIRSQPTPNYSGRLALALTLWADEAPPFEKICKQYGLWRVLALLGLREAETVDRTCGSFLTSLLVYALLPALKRSDLEYAENKPLIQMARRMISALPTARVESAASRTTRKEARDKKLRRMALDYLRLPENRSKRINGAARYLFEHLSDTKDRLTEKTIRQKLKGIKP